MPAQAGIHDLLISSWPGLTRPSTPFVATARRSINAKNEVLAYLERLKVEYLFDQKSFWLK
jgi:hypothetical protein